MWSIVPITQDALTAPSVVQQVRSVIAKASEQALSEQKKDKEKVKANETEDLNAKVEGKPSFDIQIRTFDDFVQLQEQRKSAWVHHEAKINEEEDTTTEGQNETEIVYKPFDPSAYAERYQENISPKNLQSDPRVQSLFAQTSSMKLLFAPKYEPFTSNQTWPTSLQVRLGSLIVYNPNSISTQTLMMGDGDSPFGECPIGTCMLTDRQISGRGRGKNSWAAPQGCLTFTYTMRVPNGSLLPCIQYLVCLGVVHAAQSAAESKLLQVISTLVPDLVSGATSKEAMMQQIKQKCSKFPLRIKWPNDLLVVLDSQSDEHDHQSVAGYKPLPTVNVNVNESKTTTHKVGGVLCNSTMSIDPATNRPFFDVFVGIGINVENSEPTTSLNVALQSYIKKSLKELGIASSYLTLENKPTLTREEMLADITALTDRYVNILVDENSFDPFIESYTKAWLHSGQRVNVRDPSAAQAQDPDDANIAPQDDPAPTHVVVGIAPSGYLKALSLKAYELLINPSASDYVPSESDVLELHPDGNSFDFKQSFIGRKIT